MHHAAKVKAAVLAIIYYLQTMNEIVLIMAYSKSKADNLTAEQINILRKIIKG